MTSRIVIWLESHKEQLDSVTVRDVRLRMASGPLLSGLWENRQFFSMPPPAEAQKNNKLSVFSVCIDNKSMYGIAQGELLER